MTSLPPSDNLPPGNSNPDPKPNQDPQHVQQFHHQQVGARVPEKVSRGVYATGVIVMRSGTEFILDFVMRLTRPHQVTARVVLPFAVVPGILDALKRNLDGYTQRFGPPKEPPKPATPPERPPSFQEIYDDLKLPEDVLAGAYANALMVSHSPSEFCLDFVANFFPHSAVSSRVFLASGQIPMLIQAVSNSYEHFRKAQEQNPQPPKRSDDDRPFAGPDTPRQSPSSDDML